MPANKHTSKAANVEHNVKQVAEPFFLDLFLTSFGGKLDLAEIRVSAIVWLPIRQDILCTTSRWKAKFPGFGCRMHCKIMT